MLPSDLKDKFFTAPDGHIWQIRRVHLNCVRAAWIGRGRARQSSGRAYAYRQLVTHSANTLKRWREHTMPDTLKKGDTLIWEGRERVVVDGFARMASEGWYIQDAGNTIGMSNTPSFNRRIARTLSL
jgi:streptogramin lyase